MPVPRVLVVGAGATGSCAALRLRQRLGREVKIEVWEKARGPGGRMSTNRQELGGAQVRADMGAQYLSLDGRVPEAAEVADMLIKAGTCTEVPPAVLSETPERCTGPGWRHLAGSAGGVNDALKQLLEESGADLHTEKRVASIDEQQGLWRARPFDGAPGAFDAIVVAVPGCGVGGDNLNKIHGGWEGRFTPEQNRQLLGVQHDARWSFALFLSMDCQAKLDAFFGDMAVEKVVDKGPVHLLCYQSRKTSQVTGAAPAGSLTVVAHSSIEWAKRNSRASGRDERLLWEVAEYVHGLLGLDKPLTKSMLSSKVITWKQSQVTKPSPASRPHGPCMLVCQKPVLALAGDYFTESSFSGCLKSGFAAADAVVGALTGKAVPPPVSQKAQTAVPEEAGKGSTDAGAEEGGKGKGRRWKSDNKGESAWNTAEDASGDKGKGKASSEKGKGKSEGNEKGKGKSEGKGKAEGKGKDKGSGYPAKEEGDWADSSWKGGGNRNKSKGGSKGGSKGYAWKPSVGA